MTLDDWLRVHPFLEPVARFRARIDTAIGALDGIPQPAAPEWSAYTPDYETGVVLLDSPAASIDLEPTERAIIALGERLESGGFVSDDEPGLLNYVGWIARAASLRPVIDAFDAWRDDDRWLRRCCPTCGSLPAMAQLAGTDPGRRRLLVCGCCGTKWRYGRTRCPFCETESSRLSSYTVEGERGLRLDYCEACRGYLKTYDGQGHESVLLADWTSLHLDVLALDRGLVRTAASLYDLDSAQQ